MGKKRDAMTETITWVSVDERLPGFGINVLIAIDGDVSVARLLVSGMWKELMHDLWHDTEDVTHWAEMPKGPSE